MDYEKTLSGLVRVGTVTDVDNAKHLARAKFLGEGFTSGWLYVLNNKPFIPGYNQAQQTNAQAGGSGYTEFTSHTHSLTINQWMPAINDKVLVLYLPVWNADGFILGGIG